MEMQAAVKEIEGADKNTDSRSSILECPGGPGDSKDTMQYHQQPVLWPWHGKERNEKRRGDGLAKGLNSISAILCRLVGFLLKHLVLHAANQSWRGILGWSSQPTSLPAAAFNGQLLIDAKCTTLGWFGMGLCRMVVPLKWPALCRNPDLVPFFCSICCQC